MIWSILNSVLTLLGSGFTRDAKTTKQGFRGSLAAGGFLRVPFTNRPRISLIF